MSEDERTRCAVLGIDPGITGGLAFLFSIGLVATFDIPVVGNEVDIDATVQLVAKTLPRHAIIERASARPGQGVSSMFRYGEAYGALRAVLVSLKIPHTLVTPGVWKKHWSLGPDKEKSRALAIRLWPGSDQFARKKDHGRAEAALIAAYGLQMRQEGRL